MIDYDYEDPPGRIKNIAVISGDSSLREQLHAWQAFYEVLAEVAQWHYNASLGERRFYWVLLQPGRPIRLTAFRVRTRTS